MSQYIPNLFTRPLGIDEAAFTLEMMEWGLASLDDGADVDTNDVEIKPTFWNGPVPSTTSFVVPIADNDDEDDEDDEDNENDIGSPHIIRPEPELVEFLETVFSVDTHPISPSHLAPGSPILVKLKKNACDSLTRDNRCCQFYGTVDAVTFELENSAQRHSPILPNVFVALSDRQQFKSVLSRGLPIRAWVPTMSSRIASMCPIVKRYPYDLEHLVVRYFLVTMDGTPHDRFLKEQYHLNDHDHVRFVCVEYRAIFSHVNAPSNKYALKGPRFLSEVEEEERTTLLRQSHFPGPLKRGEKLVPWADVVSGLMYLKAYEYFSDV